MRWTWAFSVTKGNIFQRPDARADEHGWEVASPSTPSIVIYGTPGVLRTEIEARNSLATSAGDRLSRSTAAFMRRIASSEIAPESGSSARRTRGSSHAFPRTTKAASYGGK